MDTLNRSVGTLLGLAVGDAVARQLSGAGDPLHSPVVSETSVIWSDRTGQAIVGARAGLRAIRSTGGANAIDWYLGEELVEWYHDPKTSHRLPSPATVRTAQLLVLGHSARQAGEASCSDGDAVLRAVPIGLLLPPEEITIPAIQAAAVTHRHPACLEAAVAVAFLVSSLARGELLEPALIESAIDTLADLDATAEVAQALTAAIRVDHSLHGRPLQWLPCHEIPPGDDPTHVASALGLAVLVALRFRDRPRWERFEEAIELASRVPAGGMWIASLTGALLGAAWGFGAVSRHLLDRLEERDALINLARGLHLWSHQARFGRAEPDVTADTTKGWTGSTPGPLQRHWTPAPVGESTDQSWLDEFEVEGRPPADARPPRRQLDQDPLGVRALDDEGLVVESAPDYHAALEDWHRRRSVL